MANADAIGVASAVTTAVGSYSADDAQLKACCEGPREWYLQDETQLREAFATEQIAKVPYHSKAQHRSCHTIANQSTAQRTVSCRATRSQHASMRPCFGTSILT